ncbi:M20/M25/M40 family metallo-hydrolase [Sporosarcina sp. Marseille-Q4063]|uniref:M20/M25/M40 family metallo-hydrolase n=1 Tax=Sporosarcina sp. Marseille-Q4063 TaxID=2810514 RepID=UPI001BB0D67F|nr:M20/M25/M40 family metallo-hydrolase [Sporosarcina sp. Marseille-Q4063]QUW21428.1 M20/M25/M40 family metallo-hydrolase [Sporosarcina sp. Marseille-Q4063]
MKIGGKLKVLMLSMMLAVSSLYVMPIQFSQTAVAQEKGQSGAAFDQKVISRISMERIYEDVHYLSETIGPRVAGTEEEKFTANYIKERLLSYGYEVEVQDFSIPDLKVGHLQTDNGDEVLINIPSGSAATTEEGLTAELYDAGLGYAADFTDEAVGKIALISRGELTFQVKVENAIAAGSAGVLIYNNIDQAGPLNPSINENAPLPVGGITKVSGEALLEDVASQDGTVTLKVNAIENATSQNIIAKRTPKKGGNHDILHVSAHFDSVPFAPGASDNASGTAVALEMARVLKSYPIDKELRFAFVGAEEIGLVGSRYYVSQLTEDEIDRSLANFNMDMVGTSWENATAIYMNTVDGQANIVSETAAATAERIGTPSELVLYQRGSSDHVSFHDAGIAAVNFIRREPGTANLEPYYHTPLDTIEHISAERLKEAGDLVGASVYSLIRN